MLPGEQARAKVLELESALKHFKEAHHMVSMVQLIDESAILDSTEYFESVNRMGTALIQFDVRLKSVEFKLQEKLVFNPKTPSVMLVLLVQLESLSLNLSLVLVFLSRNGLKCKTDSFW